MLICCPCTKTPSLLISSSIVCTTDMTPKILGIPALGVMGYVFACIIVLYTIGSYWAARYTYTVDGKEYRKRFSC